METIHYTFQRKPSKKTTCLLTDRVSICQTFRSIFFSQAITFSTKAEASKEARKKGTLYTNFGVLSTEVKPRSFHLLLKPERQIRHVCEQGRKYYVQHSRHSLHTGPSTNIQRSKSQSPTPLPPPPLPPKALLTTNSGEKRRVKRAPNTVWHHISFVQTNSCT